MNRTGRALAMGCLLLLQPLLAQAGGNSLLIPAMGRCTLNTQPENLEEALAACVQAAKEGDAEAEYELGEFYYDVNNPMRDLNQALSYFEQASLQGHAMAQFKLGTMFFKNEEAGTDFGPLMAGTVIITLPLLLFFLSAQKRFIEGVTLTGVKG